MRRSQLALLFVLGLSLAVSGFLFWWQKPKAAEEKKTLAYQSHLYGVRNKNSYGKFLVEDSQLSFFVANLESLEPPETYNTWVIDKKANQELLFVFNVDESGIYETKLRSKFDFRDFVKVVVTKARSPRLESDQKEEVVLEGALIKK